MKSSFITAKKKRAVLLNYYGVRLALVQFDEWHGWMAYGYVDADGAKQNAKCIAYNATSLRKVMKAAEAFYMKQDYQFIDPKLLNLL